MDDKTQVTEEKTPKAASGMFMLFLGVVLLVASVVLFVLGTVGLAHADDAGIPAPAGAIVLFVVGIIYWFFAWIPFAGLRVIKPNEALVLTLFGKYYGTLKVPGFYYVNPFCVGVNPNAHQLGAVQDGSGMFAAANTAGALDNLRKKDSASGKKLSLKAITHNNGKQKINDLLGNPIDVGIVVVWRVVNTAKAVFNVDNYMDFLPFRRMPRCATRSGSTPTILPTAATIWAASPLFAAAARKSRTVSRKSCRRKWTSRGLRFWRRASRIWLTRRKSRRPCCSGSRLPPSSTPAR